MIHDINQIKSSLNLTLQSIIIEPLQIIVFILLMMYLNFKITLGLFFLIPLSGWLIVKLGKEVKKQSKKSTQRVEKILFRIKETIQAIKLVKSTNMGVKEYNLFHKENDNLNNGKSSALIALKTGGGKTVLGLKILSNLDNIFIVVI